MRTTRHLCRSLINSAVMPFGYQRSGNHIFTLADLRLIDQGTWRPSVSERPGLHPARVVRAAELLAKLYA